MRRSEDRISCKSDVRDLIRFAAAFIEPGNYFPSQIGNLFLCLQCYDIVLKSTRRQGIHTFHFTKYLSTSVLDCYSHELFIPFLPGGEALVEHFVHISPGQV